MKNGNGLILAAVTFVLLASENGFTVPPEFEAVTSATKDLNVDGISTAHLEMALAKQFGGQAKLKSYSNGTGILALFVRPRWTEGSMEFNVTPAGTNALPVKYTCKNFYNGSVQQLKVFDCVSPKSARTPFIYDVLSSYGPSYLKQDRSGNSREQSKLFSAAALVLRTQASDALQKRIHFAKWYCNGHDQVVMDFLPGDVTMTLEALKASDYPMTSVALTWAGENDNGDRTRATIPVPLDDPTQADDQKKMNDPLVAIKFRDAALTNVRLADMKKTTTANPGSRYPASLAAPVDVVINHLDDLRHMYRAWGECCRVKDKAKCPNGETPSHLTNLADELTRPVD